MAKRRYPSLRNFLGGYLHEDWPEEFGSWEKAVAHYLRQEAPAEVERCRTELRALVVESRTEAGLADLCADFGCAYRPGDGWRKWLKAVLVSLERGGR